MRSKESNEIISIVKLFCTVLAFSYLCRRNRDVLTAEQKSCIGEQNKQLFESL